MNPHLKDLLPSYPLLVIYEPGTSVIGGKVTKLLVNIPEFNQTVSISLGHWYNYILQCTKQNVPPLSLHQVGLGDNVVFPVSLTDRGVSTAPYGTILATMKAVPYTFGFWAYYEIIAARTLGVGSLVNPAGNVVHPSTAAVVSAASDFSYSDGVLDLVLGWSFFGPQTLLYWMW